MKSPRKKKRILTIAIAAVIAVVFSIGLSLSMPFVAFNINTMHTVSSFGFVDGYARVNTDYIGYENELDIRINIKIERKQSFLSFREIVNEDVTSQGGTYQNEFFYPIEEDGIYRCTITYTVTGQNGEDVITFRDTQTYRASDYPEHTHIWSGESVLQESSCSKTGASEKTCRCGETKSFEIPKTPHTPGEFVVALAPTGTKDGRLCQYCLVCKQLLAQESIPATGSVGLSYRVNADGETCTVTGIGTCTDHHIVMNEYLDGYRVTAIGKEAFRDLEITGIRIPDSVTTIESMAFFNCQKLFSVQLSAQLKEIGESAFYNCHRIKRLEFPDTLTTLGKSACSSMSGLFSVEIPAGVSEISEMLFYGCSSLYDVKLLGEIRAIGSEAFCRTAITSFVLPDSLTAVPSGIFRYCSALTSVTLPSAATSIGEYAFEGCSALTSVIIPNSVTEIGRQAFDACASLTEINLPQNLTSIGDNAFWRCSSLRSIVFPEALTSIGKGAFEYCSSLAAAHLPESATNLGADIFSGCTNLSEVSLPSGLTKIPDSMFRGCNLTELRLSDRITSIGEYAFAECKFQSFFIPESVTEIAGGMFDQCRSLKTVVLHDGVTEIMGSAFRGCTAIKDFTCPKQLESIGRYAFAGCPFSEIVLPETVKTIGDYAFESNEHLVSISIPNTLTYLGEGAFAGCVRLSAITLPSGITEIKSLTFAYCENLTELNIPESVTTIETLAFTGCSRLKTLYFPSTLKKLEGYLWVESASKDIYYNGTIAQWDAIEKEAWSGAKYTVICKSEEPSA